MSKKIFGELELKIMEMAKSGYNSNKIADIVGLNQGTIAGWAKRVGIELAKRNVSKNVPFESAFVEGLKAGKVLKHLCEELGIEHYAAIEIAKKNNLTHLLRDRKKSAAQDKRLSMEEANDRLPIGHGKIISYDVSTKTYEIQRGDGSKYNRITSQIFRGDPNLSSCKKLTEEEIRLKLLEIGYELILGNYKNTRIPVKAMHIICGYVRENVYRNFAKQGCPRCNNIGSSGPENEIFDWVSSLGFNPIKYRFKKEYKGKGKGKEIDIYIQELKLGIEYCGLFHHGHQGKKRTENGKTKRYNEKGKTYIPNAYDNPKFCHKIKLDKANALGIDLITVFGNEWLKNKDKVKSILKAKLGKNSTKIYARNTTIKEINSFEANEFLDLYHLQGASRFIVNFGLFFKDELVAVIGGNIHHRNNQEFVLNRLCFKADITVVGGASKLNSALEFWAKENGFTKIKTWSDNRWSAGKVYKAMGYELHKEIDSDYFYFNSKGTYSKQSRQKKTLIKMGAVGETEWEMAQSLKLDRIWDCGKKTWVKKLL